MSDSDLEAALTTMPDQHDIYYWIVPVRAEGTWQWNFTLDQRRHSVQMNLKQRYQKLEGTVQLGQGPEYPIQNGRISGRHIQFQVDLEKHAKYDRLRFTGVMRDGELDGTVLMFTEHQVNQQEWTADRTSEGSGEWGP